METSTWSWRSENWFLSSCSKGSAFSIGGVLPVGSRWSLMSFRAVHAVMGDRSTSRE
jgi:hypothetical protein